MQSSAAAAAAVLVILEGAPGSARRCRVPSACSHQTVSGSAAEVGGSVPATGSITKGGSGLRRRMAFSSFHETAIGIETTTEHGRNQFADRLAGPVGLGIDRGILDQRFMEVR